ARLDPRPAPLQARHAHAEAPAHDRPDRPARRLPGVAQVSTVTLPSREQEATELLERVWLERPGVLGWLTTVDHKRIGLLYFWTTLAFFAAGGVEALLMRTQLARSGERLVSPETYDQLMTMHGVTMIFFFIVPMTTGAFGNYLVPLMIGTRDMAFPRLNALSFWLFLGAGLFIYSSF